MSAGHGVVTRCMRLGVRIEVLIAELSLTEED